MKLIKNNLPLFLAILTTIIAAAIFGWLTLNKINESGKDQHGADHDPVSPTSPVKSVSYTHLTLPTICSV